ncbi:hypothetical protein QJQ45_020054 [Haematococcus lacustris]|nr:hypothetical protein QJQ45_020054 [Haematococcus lacustris]
MANTGSADPTQRVAQQFTELFYRVLRSSPQQIGKFYKEPSTLTYSDSAGSVTVSGEQDGQEQSFVQVFWLDTQANGYYIYNDLLRVEDAKPAPAPDPAPAPASAPAPVQQTSAPVHHKNNPVVANGNVQASPAHLRQCCWEEVCSSLRRPDQELSMANLACASQGAVSVVLQAPRESVPEAALPPEETHPQQANSQPAAPPAHRPANQGQGERSSNGHGTSTSASSQQPATAQQRSSWAQLLKPAEREKLQTASATGSSEEGSAPAANAAQGMAGTAGSEQQQAARGNYQYRVVVSNLPQEHLPQSLFDEEFSKYGPLKKGPGAVTIHNLGPGQGGKIAFIKFEDAAAVELAIKNKFVIGDRQCEIKRWEGSTQSYLQSHARNGGGRGGGYRGGRGGRVAPHKPPQAPCSSQESTPAAASEPGPSTPPPAKCSKRTKAEQAAEPTQPTKGKGKAAKAKPEPQPGRWLDRDCNAALNMQRTGESRWRTELAKPDTRLLCTTSLALVKHL